MKAFELRWWLFTLVLLTSNTNLTIGIAMFGWGVFTFLDGRKGE